MSRTYRCKSGDRWWRQQRNWYFSGIGFGGKTETHVKYWESDNPDRHGIVKKATKRQHREVSRADKRRELSLVMKDVEHDFYNRENLYKGFSWNWD